MSDALFRPGSEWCAKNGPFAAMSELQSLSADLLIHIAGTLQIPL